MRYDVVIIGAGPAGLSAAIYLRRAMFSVAVMEKQYFPGGQLLLTQEVENYPGFESITGEALSDKFKAHAEKLGAEFIKGEVTEIKGKTVVLSDGREIGASAVVIAAGCAHKKLNIKGEQKFSGRGVSYCAVCDGAFFAGKDTAVIGGGDTALEDALYLAKICKSVTLVHRRDELRASKILQERFFSMENTSFIGSDEAVEFKGEKLLEQIVLKSGKILDVSGAFVAIGQLPQDDFIPDTVKKNDRGYIVTDELCRTNVDGIFAAGDVIDKPCRQIVTAAADGAIVSLAVAEYLRG